MPSPYNGTPPTPTNSGTSGNDTLSAHIGANAMFGLAGDDSLTGGPEADFIDGGGGQRHPRGR